MPAARPLPFSALREAARIAREENVTVHVERGADGTIRYDIGPSPAGGPEPADLIELRDFSR